MSIRGKVTQFPVSSATSCSNPVVSKTGTPIDTSGQFHNGPSFANYEELRTLIAQREPDFARGFTEHLRRCRRCPGLA